MSYFDRKGSVDVLMELDDGEQTYSQLEEKIDVSSATLSERLDEAQNLNLIYRYPIEAGENATLGYKLTPLGAVIVKRMRDKGIPELRAEKRDIEQALGRVRSEIQEETEIYLDVMEKSDAEDTDELMTSEDLINEAKEAMRERGIL
jgi:DNA-binding HxlR family transcriptional regulator